MRFDPARHHRRSIRLKGYDYSSPGAYFVTLCIQDRARILGSVVDGSVVLSPFGELASLHWQRLPGLFPHIALDEFQVMPNHLHGVVVIMARPSTARPESTSPEEAREAPESRPAGTGHGSLGAIVQHFKKVTGSTINRRRGTPGLPVWQRNYYEHIVRDERDLTRIRDYIVRNPANWAEDPENR